MLQAQVNKKVIVASFLALFTTLSLSNTNAKPEHRGPPPEAIEACADKIEGDACSFISPRNDDIEGSCIIPPRDEASLVCAPAGGPPHHHPDKEPKE